MSIDKNTYRIMTYIKKHQYVYYSDLKKHFPQQYRLENIIRYLEHEGYISYRVVGDPAKDEGYEQSDLYDVCHLLLLEKGIAYVEDRNRIERYQKIPLWISIIALIVASASIVLTPYFNVFFTRLYGL